MGEVLVAEVEMGEVAGLCKSGGRLIKELSWQDSLKDLVGGPVVVRQVERMRHQLHPVLRK